MNKILINGGELFNKGAQAMTFTVIDELKRRYPEKEIYILSTRDYLRSEEDKCKYNFNIIPSISNNLRFEVIGGIFNLLYKIYKRIKKNTSKYIFTDDQMLMILKDTFIYIDISGYALSSQFRLNRSISYLLNILVTKKMSINTILLPQSFGPFNYKGTSKILINSLMKSALPYPKYIFAREQEGVEYLKIFTEKNVKQNFDIILQRNFPIQRTNIFKFSEFRSNIDNDLNIIKNQSVAIIPNAKIMHHGNKEILLQLYKDCIQRVLKESKTVYLICHSFEDLQISKTIKKMYLNNDEVVVIEKEYNCFEIEEIMKRFQFIIASRYHSIVHAYKNGTPSIILGWATKYKELAFTFGQEQYLFDVRENIESGKVLQALHEMINNRDKEHIKIKDKVSIIEQNNIFDEIFV